MSIESCFRPSKEETIDENDTIDKLRATNENMELDLIEF